MGIGMVDDWWETNSRGSQWDFLGIDGEVVVRSIGEKAFR